TTKGYKRETSQPAPYAKRELQEKLRFEPGSLRPSQGNQDKARCRTEDRPSQSGHLVMPFGEQHHAIAEILDGEQVGWPGSCSRSRGGSEVSYDEFGLERIFYHHGRQSVLGRVVSGELIAAVPADA